MFHGSSLRSYLGNQERTTRTTKSTVYRERKGPSAAFVGAAHSPLAMAGSTFMSTASPSARASGDEGIAVAARLAGCGVAAEVGVTAGPARSTGAPRRRPEATPQSSSRARIRPRSSRIFPRRMCREHNLAQVVMDLSGRPSRGPEPARHALATPYTPAHPIPARTRTLAQSRATLATYTHNKDNKQVYKSINKVNKQRNNAPPSRARDETRANARRHFASRVRQPERSMHAARAP